MQQRASKMQQLNVMVRLLLLVYPALGLDSPEIETPLGKILGKDYGDFVAFKGVPYSEPPGRFEAPRAKLPWTGIWNGTKFGNSCIHGFSHHDPDPLESYVESEDCLYANVWVPPGKHSQLPVVVFIHGGGFVRNSGATPNFWGDAFVTNEQPAILVTFNYRLGIFGFFSWNGTTANVGFQDQQLLLRWVQQNIEAFGGDPRKVLLMGQSAGAMSVLCHVAAPGSAGLFHSAMANSPVGLYYRDRSENDDFVRSVAHSLLCTGNVTVCLQHRPAKALRDVDVVPEYLRHFTTPCPECANVLAWLPIVDPQTLPLNPVVAIERNLHNKVPTIISTVTNETLAFVPSAFMKLGNNQFAYDHLLGLLFDDRAKKVEAFYSTSSLTWAERIGLATTDALMTCFGRYVARALADSGASYLSNFMVQPHSSQMHKNHICVQGPPNGASCHAADISYQIPMSQRMSSRTQLYYANKEESEFAKMYAKAIIGFAGGSMISWIPYGEDVSTSWNLEGPVTMQRYHQAQCDFWEDIGYADVWKSLKSPSQIQNLMI